jgi:hypothetical protein
LRNMTPNEQARHYSMTVVAERLHAKWAESDEELKMNLDPSGYI